MSNTSSQNTRLREARYRAIISATVDAIITIDENGLIQDFNPAAEKMFGYSPEEIHGENIKVLTPEPTRSQHDHYLKRYIESGESESLGFIRTVIGMRKNGTTFPLELAVSEFRDENGLLFIGTLRDITLKKKTETNLKVSSEKVEQKNRDIEFFMTTAAHDLQEPIRKIKTFNNRLKKSLPEKIGKTSLTSIDRIEDAANRMQQLIDALMLYTRGSHKLESALPIDMSELIRDSLASLDTQIENLGAEIKIGKLFVVSVEEGQMRQVFQNLIGNALKYHQDGVPPKIKITGSLVNSNLLDEEGLKGQDKYYELSVEDNGIGIDSKYLESIFTIFKRLHSREKYQGTGIGLAYCRRVIERHGGTIHATSAPGKGSTFIIRLPFN